jgi:hypothetical protein
MEKKEEIKFSPPAFSKPSDRQEDQNDRFSIKVS